MLLPIILMIAITEGVAQYFIKKYHEIPHNMYYVLGVSFYAIVAFLLHKSYSYSTMGMSQILWSGMSVIVVMTIGSFVFGETIEINELLGVLFILSGIAITQIKHFV